MNKISNPKNCHRKVEEEVDESISLIILISNLISMVLTIIVIYNYIRLKEKYLIFQLIIIICLSDFIWSITRIIASLLYFSSVELNLNVCQLFAFLKTYFGLIGFFATAIVTNKLNQLFYTQLLTKNNYYFCLGLPLILALMYIQIKIFLSPFILKFPYGNSGYNYVTPLPCQNCFIVPTNQYEWTSHYQDSEIAICLYLCFYGPLWIVCIFNFIGVFKFMRKNRESSRETIKLCGIPLILFFCWIWITIERILLQLGVDQKNNLSYFNCIYILEQIFIGLNGAFNVCFYGYSIKVSYDRQSQQASIYGSQQNQLIQQIQQ